MYTYACPLILWGYLYFNVSYIPSTFHISSFQVFPQLQVNLIPPKQKSFKFCINLFQGIFSQAFDLQASDFENDDSYHRGG